MTSVRVPGLSAAAAFFQPRTEQPPSDHPRTDSGSWARLRVVPDSYVPLRLRARRRRRVLAALVTLAAVVVLGVAAAHAALIQGQLRLQGLEEEVADQQGRYQRLRLEVARLESPERIVSAAQERLGMVPPPGITYLSPSGPVTAEAPAATEDSSSSSGVAGWAAVKPYTVPVGR